MQVAWWTNDIRKTYLQIEIQFLNQTVWKSTSTWLSHFPQKLAHNYITPSIKMRWEDSSFIDVNSQTLVYKNVLPSQGIRYHGRKILIVFVTWSRQKGHLETAEEHLRQSTWPQGTIVILTSALKHTRQIHAAFAESASFAATSDFSCILFQNMTNFQ